MYNEPTFFRQNASNSDLKLPRENVWAFASNEASANYDAYVGADSEGAMNADMPLVFAAFPSAKDPKWADHPGEIASSLPCGVLGGGGSMLVAVDSLSSIY